MFENLQTFNFVTDLSILFMYYNCCCITVSSVGIRSNIEFDATAIVVEFNKENSLTSLKQVHKHVYQFT